MDPEPKPVKPPLSKGHNMSSRQSVTVIGLGPMGRAIARAFLAASVDVTVWNRTAAKADDLVELGAKRAVTVADALDANELAVISLTHYQAMYDVLGLAPDRLEGKVIANLSSDSPQKARAGASWVLDHGARFLTGGFMSQGADITLILGTLGVQVLAAVTVATKIWSLFCRIPQACVSGTFVFYGYQLGQDPRRTAQRARTLLWYSVVPTAVGAAAVALSSPWLVRLFAGADQDTALTQLLLLAFLCTLPAYLIEHHFGEILTAHQRSGLLALGSTITTYTLSVPLAAIAAFVFGSPFLVIASALVPSAVLAWIFGRSLRRDHWNESGVKDASGAGLSA